MQCEQYIIISWYQKRCERPAKYKVSRKVLYQNGTSEIRTQNLCGVCSRKHREYRAKLDYHTFYNDADLDHEYPKIEPIIEVKV